MKEKKVFKADTPLSALFRENHHKELINLIESWQSFLVGHNPSEDALQMSNFEFDKKRIYSNRVYIELMELERLGALKVSLSKLARYLAEHTNLSHSYVTIYQQLKKYHNNL